MDSWTAVSGWGQLVSLYRLQCIYNLTAVVACPIRWAGRYCARMMSKVKLLQHNGSKGHLPVGCCCGQETLTLKHAQR